MALGYNPTLQNNKLDEITALAGTSAQIILYDGSQPATGGAATNEVATLTGNAYERNQHERLSIKLGFGQNWVRSVENLDPENQEAMSEAERIVQRYTLAAVERMGNHCAAEFDKVLNVLKVAEAMGVLLLVGRYLTHAIAVNTLELTPPKPSIFEERK